MPLLRPLSLACLLLLVLPALSAELSGKAIAVADGDTFTLLLPDKTQVVIRLAEIDAPERGQPYGNKSRQALSAAVIGRQVRVEVQTRDRYGRTVGRPYVGDLDVCAEMVEQGAAWVYREYVIDRGLFVLEKQAREAKRGLWGTSEAKAMPPWEWRRQGNRNEAPEGCAIKGNINSKGQQIYHVPGGSSYGATQINTGRGERWFCSEAEARAAGWRAPRN